MDLCVIKPLNDVRRKFSADHYATGNTSPILPPEWLHQGVYSSIITYTCDMHTQKRVDVHVSALPDLCTQPRVIYMY